jgi:hypothetical protein
MKHTLIMMLVMGLCMGLMACSNSGPTKVCTVACTTKDDCPSGLMCDTNGTKKCVQCVTDTDCAYEDEGCDTVSGRCNKMCEINEDCEDIMTGICSNSICNGCDSETDCWYLGSTDHICGTQKTCEKGCKEDDDCWIGFSCVSGACSCDDNTACKDAYQDTTHNWICE